MTHALILAAALAAQCPGNACPTIPPARSAADDGVNALRARWGLPPMKRDARLDRAARLSLEFATRTGRVHMGMDDAARRAGIPGGPTPPGGAYRNFTEGWIGGTLADYLRAMVQIRARDPREGHVADFCNPHWTHYGFAEDGRGAVLWYGYFPAESAPPAAPPVRSARQAPPPVPEPPDEPGPYDHLLATAVYLTTTANTAGTGVIVKSIRVGSEYVNTAFTVAHVVAAGNITVRNTTYRDGEHSGSDGAFPAEIVRLDRQTDAAVIRFKSPGPMPVAAIDWKPRRLKVGQPVLKCGHGLGLSARVDLGIISQAKSGTSVSTLPSIRMSIPTYGGDSGAPVFRDGKLIGIHDAGQIGAPTIGYALPVATAFTPEDLK